MKDRSLLAVLIASVLLAAIIGCSGEAMGEGGEWAEGTAGIDNRNRGDMQGDEIDPRGPRGEQTGSQTHDTAGQGDMPSTGGLTTGTAGTGGAIPGTNAGATGTGPSTGG
jgi:hypothetical protein